LYGLLEGIDAYAELFGPVIERVRVGHIDPGLLSERAPEEMAGLSARLSSAFGR